MSYIIKIMKQAPNFKLQDQDGKWHELKDYSGRWLVLYFYPKDDTAKDPINFNSYSLSH